MTHQTLIDQFTNTAISIGAEVHFLDSPATAAELVASRIEGTLLLPSFPTGKRMKLHDALTKRGVAVVDRDFRVQGETAEAGLTGVNFALADTGSLVLDSTAEDIRLATTLPPRHFALLDPHKIVADGLAAVEPLRQLHQRAERNYIAYISGPSRTADIERVLTIGVHGPRELIILLVPGLSTDFLEM